MMRDDDDKLFSLLYQIKKLEDELPFEKRRNDKELFFRMLRSELYEDLNTIPLHDELLGTRSSRFRCKFSWINHRFKRRQTPGMNACLKYFKKMGQFNKNELYLISKLNLLNIINPMKVELHEKQPISSRIVITIVVLISLGMGSCLGYILTTDRMTLNDFIFSWVTGVSCGYGIRYFWDRSFGLIKLLNKIRTLAPWLATSH
jgi:hypothetical protein